jgi:hypothetical protein
MGKASMQQIVIVGIVLFALVLIVREFKKLAAAQAVVPVETGPVAADPNVVSAGDGGPAYLSYNTPGTYYVGPPVDNYSGNAPVVSGATGNQCGTCEAFHGTM